MTWAASFGMIADLRHGRRRVRLDLEPDPEACFGVQIDAISGRE